MVPAAAVKGDGEETKTGGDGEVLATAGEYVAHRAGGEGSGRSGVAFTHADEKRIDASK